MARLRSTIILGLCAALVSFTAACGDSNTKTPDGNGMCTGHGGCMDGSGSDTVTLNDPDGGNIIFEYIYLDSQLAGLLTGGAPTAMRTIAYFLDSSTPQHTNLPTPGQCENLDAMMGWPIYIGTPDTHLDVGTVTLTGKNRAGMDVSIDVTKQSPGNDNLGRPHDGPFYQAIAPNADSYIAPDSAYTVAFGGSTTIPASTFSGDQGLFMPADYQIGTPAQENDGPLVAGTDFPVTWTPTTSTNLPAGCPNCVGGAPLGLVWLIDSNGKPAFLCLADRTSGSFTIPGATITDYKAVATARGADPTKVILSRQAVVHHLVRLPNNEATNKRRMDFLAINCWIQLMNVQ